MNNKFKSFIIIIIGVFVILISYITLDCFRLASSDFGTKPIIPIKEEKIDYADKTITRYIGLGYTVEYGYNGTTNEQVGKFMELRLFGYLISAWIE